MRDREDLFCPVRNQPKINLNNPNSCDSGLNWENNSVQEYFNDSTNIDRIVDGVVDTK